MTRNLISLIACIGSILFLFLEWFHVGLFLSLFSYFIILYHSFRVTGMNSLLFLFILLFGLYGYSVPISIFLELDMGWHRVAKLSTWEKVDDSLFSFMISNQLALLAACILFLVYVRGKFMKITGTDNEVVKWSYYHISLIAGLLSSLSEGLNFVRTGGFSAIAQGKAYYQGAVNDLVLNIPYEGFLYISMALFSQFYATLSRKERLGPFLPTYLASISVVLAINIMIGERGTLLVAIVIFALGFTLRKRITWIRKRYIALLAILYIAFNMMTLLREPHIKYDGLSNFLNTYNEQLYNVMNPANTEFGSPALNYRIFINKNRGDYDYKWGKTYTEMLWAFVPTYVYSDKPKSIIYEFRDNYFPERKEMGSTAGTGFSSLMEAYMNFGYAGPFFIYFISFFFLIYMESRRGRGHLFTTLFYLLLFNIFLIFSRSASQYILFNLILYTLQVFLVVLIYKAVPKRMFNYLTEKNVSS